MPTAVDRIEIFTVPCDPVKLVSKHQRAHFRVIAGAKNAYTMKMNSVPGHIRRNSPGSDSKASNHEDKAVHA